MTQQDLVVPTKESELVTQQDLVVSAQESELRRVRDLVVSAQECFAQLLETAGVAELSERD
jgi:putative NADH-flavin reductase